MARPKISQYDPGKQYRFAHVKLDGHYLEVHKDQYGSITCLSRLGTALELSWVPTLKNAWLRLPCDSGLIGELWVPGQPASAVKTAIAQQDPALQFSCFAVPRCEGANVHPGLNLGDVDAWVCKVGLKFTPYYSHTAMSPAGGPNWLGYYGSQLPELVPDSEGYMLKDAHMLGWSKYKPHKTADLRVVKVMPGKGRHTGRMGSLIVATSCGTEVANVSGFNDTERELGNDYWLGKIIEVKYYYVGSQGRLRHPTFVCVRDDKLEADNLEGI